MPHVRDIPPELLDDNVPLNCVWEVTLRCDQACSFCGSRAAKARPNELSTAELLDVADQLARLGTRGVTLIGGEAYLRPDLETLVRHLTGLGIRVGLQTAGRGLTPRRVAALVDAGTAQVGVSLMGTEAVHDQLHGWKGSHAASLAAIDAALDAGVDVTVNTHVCRANQDVLPDVLALLEPRRIRAWRVGLMVPMGRFADHPDLLIEPATVVDIIDTLAELQLRLAAEAREAGRRVVGILNIQIDNTLGYFGPHEQVLRSYPGGATQHYGGCIAGRHGISVESDGTVKGCPSLPTAPYDGGNVRDVSLEQIWSQADALRFARERTTEELWGHCKGCFYAEACMGGCSFLAHTTLGRRGNNPFCYHRVKQLERRGLRERLVHAEDAAGDPYDFGRFELVEEPLGQ